MRRPPLPKWTSSVRADGANWATSRLPVWSLELGLTAWAGPEVLETSYNKSVHCGKGMALVASRDGKLSCGEVELVRRLSDDGWTAGWVQPYVCGRLLWQPYI